MGEEFSRQGTSISLGARMQREEGELASPSSGPVGQQDSKRAAGSADPRQGSDMRGSRYLQTWCGVGLSMSRLVNNLYKKQLEPYPFYSPWSRWTFLPLCSWDTLHPRGSRHSLSCRDGVGARHWSKNRELAWKSVS